jgi:hypothetical protein
VRDDGLVTIRKISRDPEGIESLKLYALLTPQDALGVGLHDQARLDEFVERVKRGVSGSLEKESRLRGLRVEALFRAMLVALGGFTLLTDIDGGEPYFDDAGGPVKLPDFSIVDRDGQQLLVEVKSASPSDPFGSHAIRKTEMLGLQRYGELMKAPVAVAHYWRGWNLWTLVPLDKLTPKGKKYAIDVKDALVYNELSRFGDRWIATRPPLTLIVHVEEGSGQPTASDQVIVKITGVEISAAGVVLKEDQEANIAWFLMLYGTWPDEEPQMKMEDGKPRAIELSVNPTPEKLEQVEREGFTSIGILSSMYSSMYNQLTLTPDGEVRELQHEPDPEQLAALIPADYWDRKDRALPLWGFQVKPPD